MTTTTIQEEEKDDDDRQIDTLFRSYHREGSGDLRPQASASSTAALPPSPWCSILLPHANAGLDAESAAQAGAKKMPHKRPGRQIDRLTPRQKAMVFILGSMVT